MHTDLNVGGFNITDLAPILTGAVFGIPLMFMPMNVGALAVSPVLPVPPPGLIWPPIN